MTMTTNELKSEEQVRAYLAGRPAISVAARDLLVFAWRCINDPVDSRGFAKHYHLDVVSLPRDYIRSQEEMQVMRDIFVANAQSMIDRLRTSVVGHLLEGVALTPRMSGEGTVGGLIGHVYIDIHADSVPVYLA